MQLRNEYLFPLARICHLTARDLDALTLTEFAIYIDTTDAYIEAMNRRE